MKKKNLIMLVAVLALVTAVAGSIVAGTYARYASTSKTTATATAATWDFAAGLTTSATTTLNLYDTIPTAATTYPNLTTNTIAPGTAGVIPLTIDCAGSQVGIKLTITMKATQDSTALPEGFTFGNLTSSDVTFASATTLEGVTTVIAYIPREEVKDDIKASIPWTWAIGDDETAETGINNDDSGDSYSLDVTIKGEQWIAAVQPTT